MLFFNIFLVNLDRTLSDSAGDLLHVEQNLAVIQVSTLCLVAAPPCGLLLLMQACRPPGRRWSQTASVVEELSHIYIVHQTSDDSNVTQLYGINTLKLKHMIQTSAIVTNVNFNMEAQLENTKQKHYKKNRKSQFPTCCSTD